MSLALTEEMTMARAKSKQPEPASPVGPALKENLMRLGYVERNVRVNDVLRLMWEKAGRKMSRQRLSSLFNAVNIADDTIRDIAKALGVKPEELTRPIDSK